MKTIFKIFLLLIFSSSLWASQKAAVSLSCPDPNFPDLEHVNFFPITEYDSNFFSSIIENQTALERDLSFFSEGILRSRTVTPASLLTLCCKEVFSQTKGHNDRNLGMLYAPFLVAKAIDSEGLSFDNQGLFENKAQELVDAYIVEQNLSKDDFNKVDNLYLAAIFITKKIFRIKFSFTDEETESLIAAFHQHTEDPLAVEALFSDLVIKKQETNSWLSSFVFFTAFFFRT